MLAPVGARQVRTIEAAKDSGAATRGIQPLNRYLLSGKPLGGFEGSDFHECLHERSTYACVTYYTVGYANFKGKAAVFR